MGFLVITQSMVNTEIDYRIGFQEVKCVIPTSCGKCGVVRETVRKS